MLLCSHIVATSNEGLCLYKKYSYVYMRHDGLFFKIRVENK